MMVLAGWGVLLGAAWAGPPTPHLFSPQPQPRCPTYHSGLLTLVPTHMVVTVLALVVKDTTPGLSLIP